MLTQASATLQGHQSKKITRTLTTHQPNSMNSSSSIAVLPLDTNPIPSTPTSAINCLRETNEKFESLNLNESNENEGSSRSVFLLNDREELLIQTEEHFLNKLKIKRNKKVKVVSIFGKTGVGKSYTLNHTFFNGEEVFRTSSEPKTCTLGVWAMYNPELEIICLDTESMLGVSRNEHQRTRLLLKILAVSDVIIYRTIDARLESDMYKFLGGASKAYQEHFTTVLEQVLEKNGIPSLPDSSTNSLGPAVIIFHETNYTNPLGTINLTESPEEVIRSSLADLGLDYKAFSSIKYLGMKTKKEDTFQFNQLRMAVHHELKNSANRKAKDAKLIYLALKGLNDKFQNQINVHNVLQPLHLPAFFACQDKCQSCNASCSLSMGHKDEGEPHFNDNKCKRQHQYQNYVYLCKKCYSNGRKEIVTYHITDDQAWSSLFSTVWPGSVIECPKCGKIYERYWYGNKEPTEEAVVLETVHVWPGEKSIFGSQNSAQRIVDGVTNISNAVASIASQPTQMVTDWMTSRIAPSYWRPNNEIVECFKCKIPLTSNVVKHHCRACGEGFCEKCSSKTQPVPEHGWTDYVRVCDNCYSEGPLNNVNNVTDESEVSARKIGETVMNSLSTVKYVYDFSKNFLKDSARPTYWTPDNECIDCSVCKQPFGPLLLLHHCRECGKGVCDDCSKTRKPVPDRGWSTAVRVCDTCLN